MATEDITVVLENVGDSMEGPHWDHSTNTLLFVNSFAPSAHLWNSATGEHRQVILNKDWIVGAVVTRQKGGHALVVGNRFATLDFESGELTTLAEVDQKKSKIEHMYLNDAKCDARGRFWSGTMVLPSKLEEGELGQGTLYSIDKDHKVMSHFNNIRKPNGIAWSPENDVMYYIDSPTRRIDAFNFDLEKGKLSNRRNIITFRDKTIEPGGMCVDEEGMIWVALYDGYTIARIDPATGIPIHIIKMPVSRPTSCCFGGKFLDELYVTSASRGLTEEQRAKEPLAGSIFKITGLGVKGLQSNSFSG
ncbi:regucalcin-like [Saccoglossus kowalevskii]|uniref:Regucalcin n=1 Tax=Saccoglossus kowalevskii TaxID=10224 RepID=A0ABM0GMW8_SACKO|nr:PREDICTED: regucalcin-like [Saccoglossus kowalevskii]